MRFRKLLLFAVLFFAVDISFGLTLAQIKTEIRLQIKDSDANRRRYTDTQLLNLINQTQRDVVNVSWIIKKSTDIELQTSTTYYTYPTDLIEIHRVTYKYRNLPETSLQELDASLNNGTWEATGGTPKNYFQSPSQPNSIGIYPYPLNSSSTGTISIIYFAEPTNLSSDSDTPYNGIERYTPYHDLLVYEPCYKIMLLEGEPEKALAYKSYYESRLQILLESVDKKPNFLPGFSSQRQ
jgi:hypothetical protein